MKRKFALLLSALLLGFLLLPLTVPTAHAKDYDRILSYTIVAEPRVDDGSITFTAAFVWKALEELPCDPSHTDTENSALKIGIPNGAIREVKALSGDIEHLTHDNSYMYIFMNHTCAAGETFSFSYSWVQEYMYTLDEDGAVSYDYTPGWFDQAKVDRMAVVWGDPAGLEGVREFDATDEGLWRRESDALVAENLGYGHQIHLRVRYPDWPTELAPESSIEHLPEEFSVTRGGSDTASAVMFLIRAAIVVGIVIYVLSSLNRSGRRSYAGGFGTHYVFFNNLWYPAGPDGKPKPGSTGTVHKPKPPASSGSSGFGGGKRGGGFGGSGFGGGSRCACASSCACACACACAGGGRAGCSAKNLYGAILLDEAMSRRLLADGEETAR